MRENVTTSALSLDRLSFECHVYKHVDDYCPFNSRLRKIPVFVEQTARHPNFPRRALQPHQKSDYRVRLLEPQQYEVLESASAVRNVEEYTLF